MEDGESGQTGGGRPLEVSGTPVEAASLWTEGPLTRVYLLFGSLVNCVRKL